jgi:hypothetical protein
MTVTVRNKSHCMPYQTPPRGTPGPVGDGEYTVVEGDCVESIAVKTGHLWKTIWDHPRNASIKKARVSPNVLLPGDRLYIPEKVLKTVDRPTDQRHVFVREGLSSKLRLCIKRNGEPRSNQPYRLVIDGILVEGTTDGDGWIDMVIPADAKHGQLSVGEDPRHSEVFSLELGGMDPITEPTGIQKRLRSLGFACHATGEMDEATLGAIALFQKGEDLEPTGELDSTTLEKLKKRYGS